MLPAAIALALRAQAPPLIDREILLAQPEFTGAQVSPNGKYIAFLKPSGDSWNLWVKPASQPVSAARPVTSESGGSVAEFVWTADAKYLCFVTDNNRDGNFNLFIADPAAPISHNLTGLKGDRIEIVDVPANDADTLFIAVNDRDKNWPDLYEFTISTGKRTLLRKNTDSITGWVFDLSGRLRLATRSAANGDQEILRVDTAGLTKVYSCSVFEVCRPARFHRNGKQVYLAINAGAADLEGLALFDPSNGRREPAATDPLGRADLAGALFSNDTGELMETNYLDDKVRHYFNDKAAESDFHWLQGKLPDREITVLSESADEQFWLIMASGDTEPGEAYLFDRKARAITLQFRIHENLARSALAPTQAVRYQSFDGLEIPAYLTLPVGVPAKKLPTLVIAHPGPWEREGPGFNPVAQFFANRGYAVLTPNYRGSSGYGKRFVNAGNGEWGRAMQDDLTSGVKFLVGLGIADPDRVGIVGSEYGGYAALAGAAFTPDIYKAAIDIAGPSNLLTMLGVIPAYWEGGRRLMYTRLADPRSPRGAAWLKARSSVNATGKIRAALLVAQGGNDQQAARRDTEQIVANLRDRHIPVQYLLAPDEGHGFRRTVNRMALFMATEKFLANHLGGRYQEQGSPATTNRLAEISVDLAKVAKR